MKAKHLIFCAILFAAATVSAQINFHVKPKPMAFTVAQQDIDVIVGAGAIAGVPYEGGVGPYTCTIGPNANLPQGVTVDSNTAGYCTITIADTFQVPAVDYNLTLTVKDSKSQAASVPVVITGK